MKDIQKGDIVKFVPYYKSTGMQGSSLKLQLPKYDTLALVYRTYTIRGVGHAHIMLPNRERKIVGFAGLETLFRVM